LNVNGEENGDGEEGTVSPGREPELRCRRYLRRAERAAAVMVKMIRVKTCVGSPRQRGMELDDEKREDQEEEGNLASEWAPSVKAAR